MDEANLIYLLAAILGGGTLASIGNSIIQRRKVGADSTSVLTAAARELVDPLRQELANERRDHAEELELEHQKVIQVRDELAAALAEAHALRQELAMARVEADALRSEREKDRKKMREQANEIIRLKNQGTTQ